MSSFWSPVARAIQQKELARQYYWHGEAHVCLQKAGASPRTQWLSGRLVQTDTGWLMLEVPNALMRGCFAALHEPGIELPPKETAHISVMTKDEAAKLESIPERGKSFRYTLGPVKSVRPDGWKDIDKCWMVQVRSPELERLRESHGLPSLPRGEQPFHCTFAVHRAGAKAASAVSVVADLKAARKKTDTAPSAPQIAAGNYRKGKVRMHGLDIAIENPKGSTRSGTDANGRAWSITMKHDYGYVRRTAAGDGDAVDVFIGPQPDCESVYVVNQVRPDSRRFDEYKVMLGFPTEAEAKAGYLANYEKNWKGLGEIVPLTIGQFKEWLQKADLTKPAKPPEVKKATEQITLAVDLDGTVLEYDGWKGADHFGKPRAGAKAVLKQWHDDGFRIIIHTTRGDTKLVAATLKKHDIPFDYINENPDQPPDGSAKPIADVYVDDRAVNAKASWSRIDKTVRQQLANEAAEKQEKEATAILHNWWHAANTVKS